VPPVRWLTVAATSAVCLSEHRTGSRVSHFPLVFSAAMVLCARAALADAANPVESEIVAIVVTPELAIAVERQ